MVQAWGTGASEAHSGDEPEPRVVGTVADEAARLVELLASRPAWGEAGRRTGPEPDTATGADGVGADDLGAGDFGAHPPGADDPARAAGPDVPRPGSPGECTCGGRAPACRVCPVCQLISFVSQISPETFDRAADLIDFAATALRDLATARRGEPDGATSSEERPDPAGPQP